MRAIRLLDAALAQITRNKTLVTGLKGQSNRKSPEWRLKKLDRRESYLRRMALSPFDEHHEWIFYT